MKKKPSLDEFRSGGSDGAIDSTVPASPTSVSAATERINKTIRIRKVFEGKLKEDAFLRTQAEGCRVTESDIIDEALDFYWAHKKQDSAR